MTENVSNLIRNLLKVKNGERQESFKTVLLLETISKTEEKIKFQEEEMLKTQKIIEECLEYYISQKNALEQFRAEKDRLTAEYELETFEEMNCVSDKVSNNANILLPQSNYTDDDGSPRDIVEHPQVIENMPIVVKNYFSLTDKGNDRHSIKKEKSEAVTKVSKSNNLCSKRNMMLSLDIPNKQCKLSLSRSSVFVYPLSSLNNIEMTEDDLACLSNGECLSETIINFYLMYIYNEKFDQSQKDLTHIFNVAFSTELIGQAHDNIMDAAAERYARVSKWTENVDIFEKNFVVIPIIDKTHWLLAIVCFSWMAGMINYAKMFNDSKHNNTNIPVNTTDFAIVVRANKYLEIQKKEKVNAMPCILLFDSLQVINRQYLVNIIRQYLQYEWDLRRSNKDGFLIFDQNTFRGYNPQVPYQKLNSKCDGLYPLHYFELFFNNPFQSYDKDWFSNGLLSWFKKSAIKDKKQTMRSLILSKSKVKPVMEDSDEEDLVYDFIVL